MKPAHRSIVLIGFMGAGKSSVGRRLAQTQSWPFFETDAMITGAVGMPIMEIFARLGEERFREEESAVLQNLDPRHRSIIVTGGGAVLRPRNVVRLRELGTVVCLTADLATLRQRLAQRADRPLLQTENRAERIETLLRAREPFYKEAADFTFDTSLLSDEEVAESIRQTLALTN
ncbi:MAG: shikimate kinase [Chthoniobacterales bacterium]